MMALKEKTRNLILTGVGLGSYQPSAIGYSPGRCKLIAAFLVVQVIID